MMRSIIGNAIRWWEPRRLIYNGVLALYFIGLFLRSYPLSKRALNYDSLLFLFGLAVLANVAYCAAYLPDIVLQLGGQEEALPKARWGLLAIGTAFALVLTHFWGSALLANAIS